MKQEHTEESILHTDDQQNTGNHKKPGSPDQGGADKVGGTRAGAENVETGHENYQPDLAISEHGPQIGSMTDNTETPPAPDTAARPAMPASDQPEIGGPKERDPTRFGDWTVKGRCIDF